jgi:crossover junction endodeoxyribonuclease RusA
VQKFEPSNLFRFSQPTAMLARAMDASKPLLYVRISDDPVEDLV